MPQSQSAAEQKALIPCRAMPRLTYLFHGGDGRETQERTPFLEGAPSRLPLLPARLFSSVPSGVSLLHGGGGLAAAVVLLCGGWRWACLLAAAAVVRAGLGVGNVCFGEEGERARRASPARRQQQRWSAKKRPLEKFEEHAAYQHRGGGGIAAGGGGKFTDLGLGNWFLFLQ